MSNLNAGRSGNWKGEYSFWSKMLYSYKIRILYKISENDVIIQISGRPCHLRPRAPKCENAPLIWTWAVTLTQMAGRVKKIL